MASDTSGPGTATGPDRLRSTGSSVSGLVVDAVSVRFGDVAAVDGVDLHVPPGTVTALLGPSGCGKSTLLRAVAGLEPLASGSIRWNGQDLAGIPVHRRGTGLLFQDGVLFPHRTVAGNIGYGLARQGVRGRAAAPRIAELLDLVGLPGFADRTVQTLSGGQAQRVALARALAPRPAVLLLDEPLAALDRELRERLAGDLRTVLAATGTTALFVTHDPHEAFTVADRLAVMDAGRIRQSGELQDVRRHPVDGFVAGFVGYPQVVDADGFLTATAPAWRSVPAADRPAAGGRLALQIGALTEDPAGPLAARCLAVRPGPDSTVLSVELPGVGPVLAAASAGTAVRPGGPVRLRLRPDGVVALPRD
ncbi:ABC transporter ATP-binding protein [Nakamurella endophytica]|uniref:ABC-type quaternary amine transporter n=1 Tax=Nakamurella endophytica TaxID=1748367 RepID=A0A917SM47_9ACTN|nr:ABC transporter ATP-binding protein [Nakamurella endophytica]GGL86524.1 ABC transporter [Nakamurella endophytica]